jgi:Ca2+/Na+ antiporter
VFWLPTVVAIGYGLVVFVFAAAGVLFGDEGGSWGEVAGAVAGNFALVWVAVLVVSAIIRRLQKD